MKSKMKQLLVLLLLLCPVGASAQDVIVKKDGSTIVCRIVELTDSEIVYKKWTDLTGSNYVMSRADASAINYENGRKEELSEMTNLYAPNNQNDGTHQFNDRVLIAMDKQRYGSKQAKSLRTKGWIGGIASVGVGALLINIGKNADYDRDAVKYYIAGGICVIGGITWTTVCLMKAHKMEKDQLEVSNIWQNELKLNNGSSLTARVDVLKDQILKKQAIGLGLQYNF